MKTSEWFEPGKTVGVVSSSQRGAHLYEGKVERLTPTQIILVNGERFRIRDLTEVGNTDAWRISDRLIDLESEEAEGLREMERKRNLRARVGADMQALQRKSKKQGAENLLKALTRALEAGAYDE